jgi:uncharacterized membrane protein (UPF0127 family)
MAPKRVDVLQCGTNQVIFRQARWCSDFFSKLRGLQFRRRLNPGEAIILVSGSDSIANSSIHMFFVFFPIAGIWINSQGLVTSAQLAKPWRPYYASSKPARYVLEASPDILDRIKPGDQIEFVK